MCCYLSLMQNISEKFESPLYKRKYNGFGGAEFDAEGCLVPFLANAQVTSD